MIERSLALVPLLGVAGLLLLGHSPYRQWYAYRAKHLVVVSAESQPGAAALAEAVAAAIAAGVPESKAVATAVRTTSDVVSLLNSGQLQVGLLPSADARHAVAGTAAFAEQGPVPLRAVAVIGDDVLVVLESYPAAKARDLARALRAHPGKWPEAMPAASEGAPPIPFHPGVAAR
jgi:TRAP-type uncharacterized transport system substrate-binding protein